MANKLRRKYRPSKQLIQSKASRIVRRPIIRRREIDHGKTWYIIRAVAGRERRAERGLLEQGYDVFWPVEDNWRIWRHRCSELRAGWLGGYMFVGFETFKGFDKIREQDGVAGFVGMGRNGPPLKIPPELVQCVADQVAGLIPGSKNNASAGFKRGSRASVAAGPFAELAAIIEQVYPEAGRAVVKLEMFGKDHAVEIAFEDLRAA